VLAARIFTATGGFTRAHADYAFGFSTAIIVIILLLGYSLPHLVTHTGLLAPLPAILIASIASGAFVDKILKPKWFVLLGQSSFALYMLHWPLLVFAAWYVANRTELGHLGRLAVVALVVVFLWHSTDGRSSAHHKTPKVLASVRRRDAEIFRLAGRL